MKKIIILLCAGILTTSAFAQDDVSIMDLKETVYILINQVKHLKINNDKKIHKLQGLVSKNLRLSARILQENNMLKLKNIQLQKQEVVLSNELLNMESLLNTYITAEKQIAQHTTVIYPQSKNGKIITLNNNKNINHSILNIKSK